MPTCWGRRTGKIRCSTQAARPGGQEELPCPSAEIGDCWLLDCCWLWIGHHHFCQIEGGVEGGEEQESGPLCSSKLGHHNHKSPLTCPPSLKPTDLLLWKLCNVYQRYINLSESGQMIRAKPENISSFSVDVFTLNWFIAHTQYMCWCTFLL